MLCFALGPAELRCSGLATEPFGYVVRQLLLEPRPHLPDHPVPPPLTERGERLLRLGITCVPVEHLFLQGFVE